MPNRWAKLFRSIPDAMRKPTGGEPFLLHGRGAVGVYLVREPARKALVHRADPVMVRCSPRPKTKVVLVAPVDLVVAALKTGTRVITDLVAPITCRNCAFYCPPEHRRLDLFGGKGQFSAFAPGPEDRPLLDNQAVHGKVGDLEGKGGI